MGRQNNALTKKTGVVVGASVEGRKKIKFEKNKKTRAAACCESSASFSLPANRQSAQTKRLINI